MKSSLIRISVICIALLFLSVCFSAFSSFMTTTPNSASNFTTQSDIVFLNAKESHFTNLEQTASDTATVHGVNENQTIPLTSASGSQYNVTFTESGLPSGTDWVAILNGTMLGSMGNTIEFAEPNGSYSFSVQTVNYTGSLRSGTVVVYGHPVNVSITFTKGVKMGYLSGSLKPSDAQIGIYVNMSLVTYKENNGTYNISLSPGTYRVSIYAPGYVTYSSVVTINSSAVTHLDITSMTPMDEPGPIGLVVIMVAIISVVSLTVYVILNERSRRRKRN